MQLVSNMKVKHCIYTVKSDWLF